MITALYVVEIRDDAGHRCMVLIGDHEGALRLLTARALRRLEAGGLGPFTTVEQVHPVALKTLEDVAAYIAEIHRQEPAALGDLAAEEDR